MTQQEGIIKSLETLIKHEKAIQRQEEEIEKLKGIIEGSLQAMQGFLVLSAVLSRDIENLQNKKFSFGPN
jgi:hypothetical protein